MPKRGKEDAMARESGSRIARGMNWRPETRGPPRSIRLELNLQLLVAPRSCDEENPKQCLVTPTREIHEECQH